MAMNRFSSSSNVNPESKIIFAIFTANNVSFSSLFFLVAETWMSLVCVVSPLKFVVSVLLRYMVILEIGSSWLATLTIFCMSLTYISLFETAELPAKTTAKIKIGSANPA